MKSNIIRFAILSFLSLVINTGMASAKAEGGIATINVEKIYQAKVIKNIGTQIAKKRDKFQKQISSKEKSLEKEQKKLEAKKDILSSSALQEEQKKFFKKVEGLRGEGKKKNGILKKAHDNSMKRVNEMVSEIVNEVAQQKGLTIVLPASQVVYAVEAIDITSQVIVKLDKKITKLKVQF